MDYRRVDHGFDIPLGVGSCIFTQRGGDPPPNTDPRIYFFLHFFGVTHLEHEAKRPLIDFVVAVVGPLTSVLLALVFYVLWFVTRGASSSLTAVTFTLFAFNLGFAAFNMLAGFPLDGGRVLRSVVWGISGNYRSATQVAARYGQLIGVLIVGAGAILVIFGELQGIGFAVTGGILITVATRSYRQERARRSHGNKGQTGDERSGSTGTHLPKESTHSPEPAISSVGSLY